MKGAVTAIVVAGGSLMAGPVLLLAAAGTAGTGAAGGPVTRAALAAVPAPMLRLYASAAASCPGLPWQVVAAIGTVESSNDTSNLPGVHSGRNGAGAEGPMQFEPATFAAYAEPVPPGGADPPSPYDPVDAVYAAARMLCASGAGQPDHLGGALYAYNHSAAYVAQVLDTARSYALGPAPPGGTGLLAVDYALAQVGTPYRWGGEQPGSGFDCSGLTQAAYAAAGIAIPRVAQDQYLAGPPVGPAAPLAVGDLVFFGPAPGEATHVGLVVDPAGVMVDAPHAGAAVRVEPFPTVVGALWGSDAYLGATAPFATAG